MPSTELIDKLGTRLSLDLNRGELFNEVLTVVTLGGCVETMLISIVGQSRMPQLQMEGCKTCCD